MKKSKTLLLLSLIFGFILLCSCKDNYRNNSSNDKNLEIVTSFYPVYAITKEICGNLNDVRMINSINGIHSYEPSAADIKAINDSNVFIFHSRTLESWARNLKETFNNEQVKIIEASDGLKLKRVQGLEDIEVTEGIDEKSLYDPHTWLDPILVKDEARIIAEKLSELDPENKKEYLKNADTFGKEAIEISNNYDERFKKFKSRTFVTQHTAFSYIAERYDLKQLGISGIEDEEPSPKRMAEISEFVKEKNVKTIFAEPQTSRKKAETIAKSTGAKIKMLNPLEADPQNNKRYLENLADTLNTIAEDLERG
ncbi:adhesion protein [Enterococcus casseliflavus]|nr:adhesion protein [Enterococcus casseliflavus]